MVPIKEMVDVLKVVREVSGIKRGSWVRIKRGMFKDDIARVSCVFDLCMIICTYFIIATHYTYVCICIHTMHNKRTHTNIDTHICVFHLG